jgi:undecaprenyl-diphosphatase
MLSARCTGDMSELRRARGERRAAGRGGVGAAPRDALYRYLRWAGPRLRSVHAVLGLYLSIALAATMALTLGFAWFARVVTAGRTYRFDLAVMRQVERWHTPQLDVLALEITALGSITVISLVALVASLFLWSTEHRYSVLLLWVAIFGGAVLNVLLKGMIDRPRPEIFAWRTPHAGQSSFPSGHAMLSMVVYWTVAFLVARLERPAAVRALTWLGAIGLVLLIGASRIYLGVHYPSDVVAGFVMGFVWATCCATGIEVFRYFRQDPAVRRDERDLDRPSPLAPRPPAG